ncbi:hypothetical protein ACOCEA_03405 [Maribacter sp. CXY002]|uniref:hypothetical protein n=1 Tax=Maribacter luteocoastalis TaxID=3407671 RepID=UPI003B67CE35
MSTIQGIARTLYQGFRPYISKAKLEKYDEEFNSKKMYTSKFVLNFFPKYVNEKVWMKKPKERRDTYLFNYFFIEVPVIGLKHSKLLSGYMHDRELRIPKGVKKVG